MSRVPTASRSCSTWPRWPVFGCWRNGPAGPHRHLRNLPRNGQSRPSSSNFRVLSVRACAASGVRIRCVLISLNLERWTVKQIETGVGAAPRRLVQIWCTATLLVAALGVSSAAHAQLKVRYPIVDYREFEIEPFADTTFDKPKSGLSNNQ